MANLAGLERELIVKRTRAGVDLARQYDRKCGRKLKTTEGKIESAKKLLASGLHATNLGVPIRKLYRWVSASTHAWFTLSSTF